MNILDCPNCGRSVETSTWSAEYTTGTSWDCDSCDWSYGRTKTISGVDADGTHPKNVRSDEQSALGETGKWCEHCETCVSKAHNCRPIEIIEAADDVMSQNDVMDELEQWHSSRWDVLEEAVANGSVHLTPIFYYVCPPGDTTEIDAAIEQCIERIIEDESANNRFVPDDRVTRSMIYHRMQADNSIEQSFIDRRIENMDAVNDGKFGVTIK